MKNISVRATALTFAGLALFILSAMLFKTDNHIAGILVLLPGIILVLLGRIAKKRADGEKNNVAGTVAENSETRKNTEDTADTTSRGRTMNEKDFAEWAERARIREEQAKQRHEKAAQEVFSRLGYGADKLDEIKSEAYKKNYYDGVYHINPSAPYGSADNPKVIGMEGCSDTLVFIAEQGGWCLTDGLGNGWIR